MNNTTEFQKYFKHFRIMMKGIYFEEDNHKNNSNTFELNINHRY